MGVYPTKEELETIRNWDLHKDKVEDLLEYIKEIWWCPDWGFILSGKRVLKLELHTGGWLGNEDIIAVLEKTLFFAMYWEKSVRGGHHYFTIKKYK